FSFISTTGAEELYCILFRYIKNLIFNYVIYLRLRRPTLFPYTTLFRSTLQSAAGIHVLHRERRHLAGRQLVELHEDEIPDFEIADRKSTRLNSSHVKISYAVFCLKKRRYTKSPEKSTTFRLKSTPQTMN